MLLSGWVQDRRKRKREEQIAQWRTGGFPRVLVRQYYETWDYEQEASLLMDAGYSIAAQSIDAQSSGQTWNITYTRQAP